MSFILEHPWLAFISIAAVACAFLWIGARDGKGLQIKVGFGVFFIGVVVCVVGLLIDTPSEHAHRVMNAFIDAAENEEYYLLPTVLDQDVVLEDHWKSLPNHGIDSIRTNLIKLHQKHTLRFNAIMRILPVERAEDVLVEISLLSRVTGIGTVPSTWRFIVSPNEDGVWKITSIDALEIMGRSYR